MLNNRIRNLDTIKKNDGKYASVMDEINRNYTVSKSIVVPHTCTEAYDLVMTGIHQSYKVRQPLTPGTHFTTHQLIATSSKYYTRVSKKVKYEVEVNEPNKKIVLKWSNDNDQYWSGFEFKQLNGNKCRVTFSEAILREDTISGMQGVLDKQTYRYMFRNMMKTWKALLDPDPRDIQEIDRVTKEIDKYQEQNFTRVSELKKDLQKRVKSEVMDKELKAYKAKVDKELENYESTLDKLKAKLDKLMSTSLTLEKKWVDYYQQTKVKQDI